MESIQNQVLTIVSSMQEILHVITSLFDYVKKEDNDMNSDTKDLRDDTYELISDLKVDISTLEKMLTV